MDEAGRESKLKADRTLGAVLLLFAAVTAAVLAPSDADLILPPPQAGPGPLLRPFGLCYSIGPFLILGLHAAVLRRRALLRSAAPVLRLAALWMPLGILALIRWRFTPYVAARPAPPFDGSLIEAVQTAALAVDLAFIALALLPRPAPSGGPRRADRAGRAARLLLVAGVAAAIWLIVLLAWEPARSIMATASMDIPGGVALIAAVILAAGLLAGTPSRQRAPSSPLMKENLTMRDRLVLLIAFLAGAVAPAYGRALDLSGARLVAGEPKEAVQAPLRTDGKETLPPRAPGKEAAAGTVRGIDLSSWRLRRGNFEHASMAGIRMVGTDLRSASFDYADLSGADLTRSSLADASLRHADLSGATLTGAHFAGASLQGTVLSGAEGRAGAIVLAQQDTPAAPQPDKPSARTDAKDRLDMTGVDLTGANLDGANLSNAILKDAILKGADLRGALFCGADLRNVDLTGAKNVGSAIFTGADLAGATLPADMPGGHIRNANLFRARIETASAHDWTGVIGSGIRNIDSLTGPPPHDAALAVAVSTVTELDGGKRPEPCSEPPAAPATP
ncbi:pentapeptide repeat-containing protein [Labrys monachus]|uniref:Uncharacterized protein YjbI with pentapeptide repeats n=1 Tax=Labrys monachus TaxID=217067 RepID=A0ABU0FM95_9HYPH|nr:pentapeptide repeat-containing protein [Labrys monachus]MDQ0395723.1 uncharacterized protein YjbI with pentapeptide repeats [Labrys monachus]